jgi:hypothetical protein
MKPKTRVIVFAGAFFASVVTFSPISQWGGPADFTFAIASQGMPSGFYYDRAFDWPTGAVSLLVDVPVWPLHLLLICFVAISFIALRSPNKITEVNASGRRQLPMRTRRAARIAQFVCSAMQ